MRHPSHAMMTMLRIPRALSTMAAAAKKSPTYGFEDAPERGPRARTYRLLLG